MKHLWDKGQLWPLFATTAAYTMNTFTSDALSGLSPFQLVFFRDPPDLTSLSFPKIDTIPVKHREYYNLLLARAKLVGNMLLEWRTKQTLEYKSEEIWNEEIFQDNQMVYLLAPHASALQMNTTKFKQDFIGPLFIDTALDKTHYRLKDATGLLLDGTYHMNHIKKGSARTPLGIVNKFDAYKTALKNTLLNKFAIETLNNKLQEVTLQEGIRNKRAIPALAIIQGVAAIGGMMIKGINALVDAKRASSLNNIIKLINENVQITHNQLLTLENRTAMMAKAIILVLKDFKQQINNTNDRLNRQYRMMTRAHDRYNRLFRQTHKTFQIHHLTLLMVKDYITILVGTLQRIHRQYI